MDISLLLINSSILVIGDSSSYPRKNDCHKVTITLENNATFGADYFPKTQLDLIRKIQAIKDKLSPDELSDLLVSINSHIQYSADVAETEQSMYNNEDI